MSVKQDQPVQADGWTRRFGGAMNRAGEQGRADYGGTAADVIVQIAEDVPPEHRGAIEASVTTLVRRSAEASRRAAERSRSRHELLITLSRPVHQMIDQD